ncbi:MAG: adenine phosphoribosyltransferase [Deltaproteobacteria bacterium]|nr:adenine phosphoribosyltransferase [Deltaproteobacteria bacterium]
MDLKEIIRSIPDFPQPGILFRDITTLLKDPRALRLVIDTWAERYQAMNIDVVAGIESRGFILGVPLAMALGKGFVPIRKPGKLPAETVSAEYSLEYGTDQIEMHVDAVAKGDRVLIVDDLLATGGTMKAACDLVEQCGAQVAECAFLIELAGLNGKDKLPGYELNSMLIYD